LGSDAAADTYVTRGAWASDGAWPATGRPRATVPARRAATPSAAQFHAADVPVAKRGKRSDPRSSLVPVLLRPDVAAVVTMLGSVSRAVRAAGRHNGAAIPLPRNAASQVGSRLLKVLAADPVDPVCAEVRSRLALLVGGRAGGWG
jgi:hypothetical protein